jgi:large subunit ribosomal protein L7/L12
VSAHKEEEMAAEKMEELIKSIETMSVLELSDLVKALEEKFGVSANMPVMAAPAAGGAAAPAAAAEEKSVFTVMLTSAGANNLVDAAPKAIKEGVNKEEAAEMKKKLEAAGATVELK